MLSNRQQRGYTDPYALTGLIIGLTCILVTVVIFTIVVFNAERSGEDKRQAAREAYALAPGELRVTDVSCAQSWSLVSGDEFECTIEVRASKPNEALGAHIIYVADPGGSETTGVCHLDERK